MKILVAGVGNVFLSDDGFGVAVVKRLADAVLPDNVTVADFGIRGIHLAYELTGGTYDSVILVDAVSRHSPPGTLYVLKPLTSGCAASFVDAHDMTPEMVLALAGTLGGETGRVLLVGCEPADISPGMELSAPVAEAVDAAAELVLELIDQQIATALAPASHEEEPAW